MAGNRLFGAHQHSKNILSTLSVYAKAVDVEVMDHHKNDIVVIADTDKEALVLSNIQTKCQYAKEHFKDMKANYYIYLATDFSEWSEDNIFLLEDFFSCFKPLASIITLDARQVAAMDDGQLNIFVHMLKKTNLEALIFANDIYKYPDVTDKLYCYTEKMRAYFRGAGIYLGRCAYAEHPKTSLCLDKLKTAVQINKQEFVKTAVTQRNVRPAQLINGH